MEPLSRKYIVNCKQQLLQSDDAIVSYFPMPFSYALFGSETRIFRNKNEFANPYLATSAVISVWKIYYTLSEYVL